jgi:hypothetical protein
MTRSIRRPSPPPRARRRQLRRIEKEDHPDSSLDGNTPAGSRVAQDRTADTPACPAIFLVVARHDCCEYPADASRAGPRFRTCRDAEVLSKAVEAGATPESRAREARTRRGARSPPADRARDRRGRGDDRARASAHATGGAWARRPGMPGAAKRLGAPAVTVDRVWASISVRQRGSEGCARLCPSGRRCPHPERTVRNFDERSRRACSLHNLSQPPAARIPGALFRAKRHRQEGA